MIRRKICTIVLTTIISLNMIGGIPVKATENQDQIIQEAKASFNNFKAMPIFNMYNQTLRNIEKIEDEGIKNPMLWDLAPYWNEVATKYVTTILDDMIALGKDKNLLSFHELMEKIEKSPLKIEKDKQWNEGYLKGELAAWSSSGCLFSKDEVIAIDSINVAWANITHVNIDKAQGNIDKVVNSKSKQWLQGEIDKIKKILKDKEGNETPTDPNEPVVEYKDFKAKQDPKTKLWGYIKNSKGDWIIQPKFKMTYDFQEELGFAQDVDTGLWGLVNEDGNWSVPPIYEMP